MNSYEELYRLYCRMRQLLDWATIPLLIGGIVIFLIVTESFEKAQMSGTLLSFGEWLTYAMFYLISFLCLATGIGVMLFLKTVVRKYTHVDDAISANDNKART